MKKLKLSDLKLKKLSAIEGIKAQGGCPPPYFDFTRFADDEDEELKSRELLIDMLPVTSDTIYC